MTQMNQNPFRSVPLAVKSDPYCNKTHKRIDILLLVVITLVLMIFAFRASAEYRAKSDEQRNAAQTSHSNQ